MFCLHLTKQCYILTGQRFKGAQVVNDHTESVCEHSATSERLQNILDCSGIYRYRQCTQRSVVLTGHPSFSASSHWSVTSQQSCLFIAHIKSLFRNHHSIYPHTPIPHLCQINELSLYTFQSHHQNARNNVTTV